MDEPQLAEDAVPGEPPENSDALLVEIHVLVGTECQTIYKVPPGEYLVGRDSSCHVHVEAENVSRMHARLAFQGHRFLIEDLDSANGIRIGGQAITLPTPVQNGTEAHIGAARLLFLFSEETLSRINAALSDPSLGLDSIHQEITQDPYTVTGTLAEGGMGMVVKARDQRIRRLVAMKVLRSGFEYQSDKLMRFVGEAQLTGQLEHPNIVPVYHLGITAQGQTFYTMKFVRGKTLEEVLASLQTGDPEALKRYSFSTLLSIFQKVGDAIAFAHDRGVVHRDLKPANLMIGAFGEVLVMDWGLAKHFDPHPTAPQTEPAPTPLEASAPAPSADAKPKFPAKPCPENAGSAPFSPELDSSPVDSPRGFYTLDGAVVGTPPYISPEQARGAAYTNHLADIHVLGSILYSILTLRPPILTRNVGEAVQAVAENRFLPISEIIHLPDELGNPPPKLGHCPGGKPPEGLVAVVEKAMHPNPNERYQSVVELQQDITAWQNGFAPKAEQAGPRRQLQLLVARRRNEFLGVALFLATLLGSCAYFFQTIDADRQDLRESNQKLQNLVSQLHAAAKTNLQDARQFLLRGQPKNAIEQVNLALVGADEEPEHRASCLLLRGKALITLGAYIEALQDYQKAALLLPGLLPIDIIETDLASEDPALLRPDGGWPWERIEVLPRRGSSGGKEPPTSRKK
jgi:serine/threonine protein kinase